MLKRLNKRSGNRYTLISIMIIILMIYFFNLSHGGDQDSYPQYVYLDHYRYEYSQMVRESSLNFVRKYGADYEGHILLLKRSDRDAEVPDKVYIFVSRQKYREYQFVQ